MTKIKFICTLLLFISTQGIAQNDDFPVSRKVKGKVRSIDQTETTYTRGLVTADGWELEPTIGENGEEIEEFSFRTIELYDKQGRLVEYHHLQPDGTLFVRNCYEYKGKETEEEVIAKYNQEGTLVSREVRENRRPGYKQLVTYNNRGERIATTEHKLEKNTVRVTSTNQRGQIVYSRESVYKEGLLQRSKSTQPREDISEISEFTYNEMGDIKEHIYTYAEGREQYTTRTFHTYEYDKQGNWIKRTSLMEKAEVPCDIAERVIKYY
ncbi:MAG: hypothetical protein LUG98_14505 [Tannerellaceae bacterium]|nr:hypothetical protein [Tannerellaceae bacterium]